MNIVLFVNTTISFSENLFLVFEKFHLNFVFYPVLIPPNEPVNII